MKTKVIVLLAVSAIVTLSFTFASVEKSATKEVPSAKSDDAPAGGFATEDKF
jgi:hypothetical protein